MKLKQIDELLNYYPLRVNGNPLLLCLLNDLEVIKDYPKFERELDSLKILTTKRYLIWDEKNFISKFPTYTLDGEVDIERINCKIFDSWQTFQKILFKQSDINKVIINNSYKYDTIVLIIVDGLSYFDIYKKKKCTPCLVDCISKTYEGYKNIIGEPTIGRNLFAHGFTNLIGFSYWDRHSDQNLTNEIFVPFGHLEPNRVRSFEEIVEKLEQNNLRKAYVQIVTHGLDQLCHKNYEEPLIDAYIDRLLNNLFLIVDIIKARKLKALVCLTSDHGILWKTKTKFKIINDPAKGKSQSPRYLNGQILRSYAMPINSWKKNYSMLRYPLTTRTIKNNEWGVHGGISGYESIIPLILKEIL